MSLRASLAVSTLLLGLAGCSGSSKDSTGTSGSGTSGSSSAAAPSVRPSVPSPAGTVPLPPGKTVLRPGDILDAPERYLNRTVEVEIVEPLSGPETPAALATATYGQVRIEMPDSGGFELSLVPKAFRPDDPSRYMNKFDRVIDAPVRVRGEFLSDDDLAKQTHRPAYVIRVASVEALAKEAPVRVGSVADLQADRARWDRKRIIYEGVYMSGFETSMLDRDIWLGCERRCETVGAPAEQTRGRSVNRVRATGILFAKPGARYGHLGACSFRLDASKIEYLGPAPAP